MAEDTWSSCSRLMTPMRFILLCLAGWANRERQAVIEYLFGGKSQKEVSFQQCLTSTSCSESQEDSLWEALGDRNAATPRTKVDVGGLVVKFAKENSGWGYGSIEGALLNLGHDIGRSTIARILKQAGVPGAPKRKGEMIWEEFRSAHWEVMAATDFFTTEIWTMQGLVR